jgi:hypothetical protein
VRALLVSRSQTFYSWLIPTLTLSVSPVFATTFTVTSTAGSGAGTLRAALVNIQNGDTINFNVVTRATITLASELASSNGISPRDRIWWPRRACASRIDQNEAGWILPCSGGHR